MSGIELIQDGDGLAIIGSSRDVEQFLSQPGLVDVPSKELGLQRLWSTTSTAGAVLQAGANIAENSGRWVKLTAESADSVRKYGLMATKTPGVSHAMVGKPGEIKQWVQIAKAPTALLAGPFALTALSTMMQQRAMQQQMDDIVDYLEQIDEKVSDILRAQKDAVLADMIGVDLIVEDALTVREEVGRVSDVTWSKVQATAQTVARTQAYALRELDAIASKLQQKADVGDIARATKTAAPKVREWLAVLAHTFHLQDGISVLELDRVMDSSPDELESHRLGLKKARQNRRDRIGRSTEALLAQMAGTIERANARVLLNPFDSPAAVKSSQGVAAEVIALRGRLGIQDEREATQAKRWVQAFGETAERVRTGTAEGAASARRLGEHAAGRATGAFRSVDIDGDGIPDRPRAVTAAEESSQKVKGAAAGVAGKVGGILRRRSNDTSEPATPDPSVDPES